MLVLFASFGVCIQEFVIKKKKIDEERRNGTLCLLPLLGIARVRWNVSGVLAKTSRLSLLGKEKSHVDA